MNDIVVPRAHEPDVPLLRLLPQEGDRPAHRIERQTGTLIEYRSGIGDGGPRISTEELEGAALVRHQGSAIRRDRHVADLARRGDQSDERRLPLQHLKKRASRVCGVVDAQPGQREPQRLPEVLVCDSLRRESFGVRDRGGERSADERHDEEQGDADERCPQTSIRAASAFDVRLRRLPASL